MEGGGVRAREVPAGKYALDEEGRGEAVWDEGYDVGVGVCEGVDSADVVFWVCGYFFEYAGLFDAVEDGGGDGEGDVGESGEREVVVGGVEDGRSVKLKMWRWGRLRLW